LIIVIVVVAFIKGNVTLMNLLKMRLVSWMWRLHHLRFHCKLRRKIIRAMIKTINLLLLLIALNYIKLH